MTFDATESSLQLASPLELYRFEAAGRTFTYCDGEDDFTYDDEVYLAVPIRRSAINSSGTLDRSTLDVSIADTTDLAARLRGFPASAVLTLVIRQGHRSDPNFEFLVAWSGRVLGARRGDFGERTMTCQPASTSLKRSGLRRNWQYPCPHVLYGPQCRASQPAASVTVTAASPGEKNRAFLPPGWTPLPNDSYRGGIVSWEVDGVSEVRTILRADDVSVTLGGPADYPEEAELTISLGCNHLMSDCTNLHVPGDEADYGGGNIRNFGGQPFIPIKNPIGFVSNY